MGMNDNLGEGPAAEGLGGRRGAPPSAAAAGPRAGVHCVSVHLLGPFSGVSCGLTFQKRAAKELLNTDVEGLCGLYPCAPRGDVTPELTERKTTTPSQPQPSFYPGIVSQTSRTSQESALEGLNNS